MPETSISDKLYEEIEDRININIQTGFRKKCSCHMNLMIGTADHL